jgi:hypothetical protein
MLTWSGWIHLEVGSFLKWESVVNKKRNLKTGSINYTF